MKILNKYTHRAYRDTCPKGAGRLRLTRYGKVMLMSAAALGMTAALTIQSASAYFTTYVSAGGGEVVHLGAQTEIHEDVSQMTKHIVLRNTSQINECFVRVKVFYADPFTVEYTDVAGNGDWYQQNDDGYWYYRPILPPGGVTTQFDAKIVVPEDFDRDSFNVVVIQECTPVLYDDNGNPYADWNMTYTEYTEEEAGR